MTTSYYYGFFVSRNDVQHLVRIEYPSETTSRRLVRLGVPPLRLSYERGELTNPIAEGRMRLTLLSEDDCQYLHLVREREGRVRIALYALGKPQDWSEQQLQTLERSLSSAQLVWRGILDPESYSEPYVSTSGYLVELEASDLGQLKRIPFSPPNAESRYEVRQLIKYLLWRVGLVARFAASGWLGMGNFKDDKGQRVVTYPYEDYYVSASLFYRDEDEEAEMCYDILEGLLRSLGWMAEQRQGEVILYDMAVLTSSSWAERDAGRINDPQPLQPMGGDAELLGGKAYDQLLVTTEPKLGKMGRTWHSQEQPQEWGWRTMARITALREYPLSGYRWQLSADGRVLHTDKLTLGERGSYLVLGAAPWATHGVVEFDGAYIRGGGRPFLASLLSGAKPLSLSVRTLDRELHRGAFPYDRRNPDLSGRVPYAQSRRRDELDYVTQQGGRGTVAVLQADKLDQYAVSAIRYPVYRRELFAGADEPETTLRKLRAVQGRMGNDEFFVTLAKLKLDLPQRESEDFEDVGDEEGAASLPTAPIALRLSAQLLISLSPSVFEAWDRMYNNRFVVEQIWDRRRRVGDSTRYTELDLAALMHDKAIEELGQLGARYPQLRLPFRLIARDGKGKAWMLLVGRGEEKLKHSAGDYYYLPVSKPDDRLSADGIFYSYVWKPLADSPEGYAPVWREDLPFLQWGFDSKERNPELERELTVSFASSWQRPNERALFSERGLGQPQLGEGMLLPTPPPEATSVELELTQHPSFWSGRTQLFMPVWDIPNWMLLKDLTLRLDADVSDTQGDKRQEAHRLLYTYSLEGQERKELKLLLSDGAHDFPEHSPAILRTASGDSLYVRRQRDWGHRFRPFATSHDFALVRRLSDYIALSFGLCSSSPYRALELRGSFRALPRVALRSYMGRLWLMTSEEVDVQDDRSTMHLVEVRPNVTLTEADIFTPERLLRKDQKPTRLASPLDWALWSRRYEEAVKSNKLLYRP